MNVDHDLFLNEKKKKMKEFISKLSELCKEYKIHDIWTTYDDTLIIAGDEISVFMKDNDLDIDLTAEKFESSFSNTLDLIVSKLDLE